VLETATNYLQNKYNSFRRLLKTSLYYLVKHKSFNHSLMTKRSSPPFFKFFKHLKKHYFT